MMAADDDATNDAGPPARTPDGDARAIPAGSVHPAIAAAWAALESASIPWVLLRGTADGSEGDVDVLVDPAARTRLGPVLDAASFHRLPAIGHGGHQFFRAYDEASDTWITLDVVDELAFGPGGRLLLDGGVAAVLAGREQTAGSTRPAADGAFWALLLHDLLDRRGIPEAHRSQLAGLAAAATADGTLARLLDGIGGRGTSTRLLGSIRGGDERAALAEGRRLAGRWTRHDPRTAWSRRIRHAIGSRLRKPFTAVRRRGIDIAVLGPDGAGKSTVAAVLGTTLPIPTRTIYLGLYAAGLGSGRFGLVRRLGRLWRGWLSGFWHRSRGRVVVYDRHALDARVAPGRRGTKARLRRWLLTHAIPNPALVLVLDAPGELLFARKGEHDPATLETQRQGYLALAARLRSAEVVDASRSSDAVRRDVTARTWRRMAGGRRHG